MSKSLTIAVLAGIASGTFFIAPMFGSILGMLLINVTHLPLLLVGLGLGTAATSVSVAAGGVLVGAAAGFGPLVSFAVVFGIPVILVTRQTLLSRAIDGSATEWYPPGRVLSLLAGYGSITFLVVYMTMAGRETGLVGEMEITLSQIFAMMAPQLGDEQRQIAASQWATMLPAALVSSWLVTLAINSAIAQRILVRMGANRRPSLDLGQIEMPMAFSYAILASGALWLFADGQAGFIGQTLTIIFAMAYLFLGLAVIHHVSRPWPGRSFALTFFYMLLLFLLGLPGFALVAGLGLADQLIGIRQWFKTAAPDKEDD
jgi:hypothetical protein